MSESTEQYEGERCAKCGEVGEDRRTLWMACFYAMNELKVPFEQVQVRGTLHDYKGEKEIGDTGLTVPQFAEEPNGPARDRAFYTLRVCKGCRASWMEAIEDWFSMPPPREKSCGSGIFVRENGAVREITREEWDARYAARRGQNG